MPMTIDAFFADYISTWEGGLSLDPRDGGNWYNPAAIVQKAGVGALIGSNHGVTGAVLASYRGTQAIRAADMAALTLDEAVKIGRKLFYDGPGFGLLPWDQVIGSAVDFGWGAGPGHAVILLQHMIGAQVDGRIGPGTAAAYKAFIARNTLALSGAQFEAARNAYYDDVIARIPADAKYRNGWRNRSHYFAPGGTWWAKFNA